ncbi:MAG: hypothetical protein ACLSGS_03915 [Adlercreutzia sp.]
MAAASDEAVPLASKGGAEGLPTGAPRRGRRRRGTGRLALTGLALGVLGLGASLFPAACGPAPPGGVGAVEPRRKWLALARRRLGPAHRASVPVSWSRRRTAPASRRRP